MHVRYCLLVFAFILYTTAFAQRADAVHYSKAINPVAAQKHLSVLASDAYAGRETGTEGGRMAATYIAEAFKSLGLQGPVAGKYMQAVEAVSLPLMQSLRINGTSFTGIQDFFNMPSSVSFAGFQIQADSILFAGYGTIDEGADPYDDYQGHSLEGKVVMILKSGPRDAAFSFQDKIRYLTFHKVKAILMVDPVVDQPADNLLQYLHTEHMVLKGSESLMQLQAMTQPLPVIFIGQRVADQLLAAVHTNLAAVRRKLEETRRPYPLQFKVDFVTAASKTLQPVTTDNVFGFIPGADSLLKDEVLLLSAHYDHLGITPYVKDLDNINNGADDNGSGTTGLLLMADAFMQAVKAGRGPKRSILFMAATGEEKGLLGSSWYVEHPVVPLANTIANLNVDMIGRTDTLYRKDPDYIYIIGANRLSSDLDRIVKQSNNQYTKLQLDERFNVRNDPYQLYYRSDHYNFAKRGIPVTFYFSGFHADYHKPEDEIDKIDFEALSKRTQLIYYTAWELANGEKRPVVDKKE